MADAWLNTFSTFSPEVALNIRPSSDTFRGGAFVVITQSGVLNTSRDALLTSAPLGWTSSGNVTFDSRRGALLKSTTTTPATLTAIDADYANFDITVDVQPLNPPSGASSQALIACLEHEVSGVGTARVCLLRGANPNGVPLFALGEGFSGDAHAGITPITTETVTLRLVRNLGRVYGFAGDVKIFDAPVPGFAALGGSVRLASRSEASGLLTSAYFRNFTVRSHASINGRLLDNKQVPTTRQITGHVPASTLTEVGAATVNLFGLFGEVSSPTSFTYTLPTPRTVANEVVRHLRTYQDPVVRDPGT